MSPDDQREEEPARLRRELLASQRRVRELEQQVSSFRVGLARLQDDLRRIAASRAWRWGHGVTVAFRRLTRRRMITEGAVIRAIERAERLTSSVAQIGDGEAPATAPTPVAPRFAPDTVARAEGPLRQRLAEQLRVELGPAPELSAWPSVSIIVVSHDGAPQLTGLLTGLAERTDYPVFDVTVVDNGSAQPLAAVIAESALPDTAVLRSEENLSFSAANNQGAAAADSEVLLFLNDDIEPFEPGWLKELVASAMGDGVGAVGATLLHVSHDPQRTASGWIVQHRGIRFRLQDHLARPFNDGDGTDLFDDTLGREQRCPAVTGAALAIRAEAFRSVGGFSDGYRFGTEDVDLGLKLLEQGWEVLCSGRSVAFHRESSTQAARSRVEIHENRDLNRQLMHRRWGPRLRRQLRAARLRGDAYWTAERAHLGITLTSLDPADGWGDWYTAHELGDALGELGLRISYLPFKDEGWYQQPDDLDGVIALLDRFDARTVHPAVTVLAWVRNWAHRWAERPWLPRIDVLMASSTGLATILEHEAGRASQRLPLATNPQRFSPGTAPREYDYVLTANRWGVERAVEAALELRPNERVAIFGKGWEEAPALAPYSHGPVPYDELPEIYRSSRLVIDDTAGPTLPYGAVNSRVFDALASGALVLTNCAAGVHELFEREFPTWSTAEDLRALLDASLADEEHRVALAARYRETVLARHTYPQRAGEIMAAIDQHNQALSFVIRIGAPDSAQAERWGDLHFAQGVTAELRRRGHSCLIQVLSEWDDPEGFAYDVAITLRGLSPHRPAPGQLNVLWSISHPDALSGSECDGYDLVAVASAPHAPAVAAMTTTPVFVLEQATDPRRFRPDPDLEQAHEIVFVGNSRGVRRRALDWLLPTDRDVAIWGERWEGLIDTSHLVAEAVANEELPRVYASAKIVLADHWDDMRVRGYISNRIYDALACGTIVLSDDVGGLAERFGDAVAVYRTPEELHDQVGRLLGDEEERRARAARGRELVLRSHTFAHRVDVLLERVRARWQELDSPDAIVPAPAPAAV